MHRQHYPLGRLERRPSCLLEVIQAIGIGLIFASPFIATILQEHWR